MFSKKKDNNKLKVKKSLPKFEVSKNEKILLGLVATGVVGYGVYAFLFEPISEKINPLEQEVKSLQVTVNSRKNIDEQLIETKKILSEKEKEYKQVVIKIPETDKYPKISKDLHTLALNNNIEINSVTFGQPTTINYGEATEVNASQSSKGEKTENSEAKVNNEEKYNKLRQAKDGFYKYTITVNYEGAYNHALNFVKAMERQEQILELTNITLSEKQETEEIDKEKEIDSLNEEIAKITDKITDLIAKRTIELDAIRKVELQGEIQTYQVERENLKDRIKNIREGNISGEKYTVTGGTITFDYYTRGEIKQENHKFNNNKYGKNDLFK